MYTIWYTLKLTLRPPCFVVDGVPETTFKVPFVTKIYICKIEDRARVGNGVEDGTGFWTVRFWLFYNATLQNLYLFYKVSGYYNPHMSDKVKLCVIKGVEEFASGQEDLTVISNQCNHSGHY